MSLNNTSKFLALILRHKPEVIGIKLDEHGWADVDELLRGINQTRKIDMKTLEQIVREDNKQRYAFNEDKTKIRANQGHSIPVDAAIIIGKRHGRPVVYKINTKQMHEDGIKFFKSVNNVWLTKEVAVKYISRI